MRLFEIDPQQFGFARLRVHVRRGGQRIRRGVSDRSLRTQARAADHVRGIRRSRRRCADSRPITRCCSPRASWPASSAASSARWSSRSSPTSCRMRAARAPPRSSRPRSRWPPSSACRSACGSPHHYSWRAPFLVLAARQRRRRRDRVAAVAGARRARRPAAAAAPGRAAARDLRRSAITCARSRSSIVADDRRCSPSMPFIAPYNVAQRRRRRARLADHLFRRRA